MSEIVTGEAVVVDVRDAQLASRAAAFAIDWIVQWTVLIVAYILLSNASIVADNALTAGLQILFTVLVVVGYPVIFETVSRGRSLGKLALGLRVVSDDGGPVRFRQALFRGLAGSVEFWMFLGAPALITSLINQRGKRLGDLFAGTIVIGERAPRQEPPPEMPPQLAPWAATLQLSQLPNELANTARQYLSRWHDLSPGVRHEMGMRIAAQMAGFVAPQPPAGVPPHAYLSAVLAERRRREELRLAQSRQTPRAQPGVPTPPPPSASPSPASPSPVATPAFPSAGAHPASSPRSASPQAPSEGPAAGPDPVDPSPGGFVPPA